MDRSVTGAGHVWRATDDTGALLDYFIASELTELAVVSPREESETK